MTYWPWTSAVGSRLSPLGLEELRNPLRLPDWEEALRNHLHRASTRFAMAFIYVFVHHLS